MKTAILTDSTAYISNEIQEKFNIHIIPLSVVFGEEVYEEEIELTASQFYEEVKVKKLPTTSQPPIGKFVKIFEDLSHHYDAIISIHLSSGISGTYQGAVAAKEMVEGMKVFPFDSEVSCMVQGFYVIEAAKMIQEGKEPEEIIEVLETLKTTSNAYFMVDDLSHLQRGGRLSSAQAFIGSLLQVKPLLHFDNKKIVPFEKIRTRKKALKRMADLLEQATNGEAYDAVIIHGNSEEEAIIWQKDLQSRFPNVEFQISYFGAVIGTHLGEGALAIGWMKKRV